jgi:hypothetical protein
MLPAASPVSKERRSLLSNVEETSRSLFIFFCLYICSYSYCSLFFISMLFYEFLASKEESFIIYDPALFFEDNLDFKLFSSSSENGASSFKTL